MVEEIRLCGGVYVALLQHIVHGIIGPDKYACMSSVWRGVVVIAVGSPHIVKGIGTHGQMRIFVYVEHIELIVCILIPKDVCPYREVHLVIDIPFSIVVQVNAEIEMEIIIVAHTPPSCKAPGISRGIARAMFTLASELDTEHEVVLLVRERTRYDPPFVKRVRASRLSWYLYPRAVQKFVKDMKADLWIADYPDVGEVLTKLGKKPLFVYLHDAIPFARLAQESLGLEDKLRISIFKRRILSCKPDAFIVCSKYALNQALSLIHI